MFQASWPSEAGIRIVNESAMKKKTRDESVYSAERKRAAKELDDLFIVYDGFRKKEEFSTKTIRALDNLFEKAFLYSKNYLSYRIHDYNHREDVIQEVLRKVFISKDRIEHDGKQKTFTKYLHLSFSTGLCNYIEKNAGPLGYARYFLKRVVDKSGKSSVNRKAQLATVYEEAEEMICSYKKDIVNGLIGDDKREAALRSIAQPFIDNNFISLADVEEILTTFKNVKLNAGSTIYISGFTSNGDGDASTIDDFADPDDINPEDRACNIALLTSFRADLDQVLGCLDQGHADMFRDWLNDMDKTTIAEKYGCSYNTVTNRLDHIKKLLKEYIVDKGYEMGF
jgi:DNA-directed RNA polymerase specialized sigma24 family protein